MYGFILINRRRQSLGWSKSWRLEAERVKSKASELIGILSTLMEDEKGGGTEGKRNETLTLSKPLLLLSATAIVYAVEVKFLSPFRLFYLKWEAFDHLLTRCCLPSFHTCTLRLNTPWPFKQMNRKEKMLLEVLLRWCVKCISSSVAYYLEYCNTLWLITFTLLPSLTKWH